MSHFAPLNSLLCVERFRRFFYVYLETDIMHTDIFSDYDRNLSHSAQRTSPKRKKSISARRYHLLDFDDTVKFYFTRTLTY